MARCVHSNGSISERSDGRWVATIPFEGGKRTTFSGKTRKETQEKLKVALSEHHQGLFATGPQQNVEHCFIHWLEHVQKPSIRDRTHERYTHMRRLHLLPDFGDHPREKRRCLMIRNMIRSVLLMVLV